MPAPIRLMVFQGYRPGYGFYNSFGEMRPLLKYGARGDAVVEAQNALMNVLQRSLRDGADGVFGTDTLAAVKEVQSTYNLPVTGMVDGDTWTLLLAREIKISGQLPAPGPQVNPPDARIAIPKQSASWGLDDGDIVVGGTKAQSDAMLYVGVGAAALAAIFLFRK